MSDTLETILVHTFQVSPETISRSATLDELGLDSLDVVELAMLIQKELGIRVTDDELVAAGSFGAAETLIENRRGR